MAQYNVPHKCGHTQTHQLFGPGKDRDRKRDWLETTECAECFKARRGQEPPDIYLRPVTDGVEIIALNSYAVKDTLKEQGYKYGEFAINQSSDLLVAMSAKPRGGWSIVCHAESLLKTELAWIESQGWTVKNLSGSPYMFSAIAAVLEGRPDVGGLPHDLSAYNTDQGPALGLPKED